MEKGAVYTGIYPNIFELAGYEKKEIEKQVKEGTQTRKTADDLIDSYEQTLDVLKNGNKVSKSVDGDKNLSITINEADLKKLDENVVLSVKYDTEK